MVNRRANLRQGHSVNVQFADLWERNVAVLINRRSNLRYGIMIEPNQQMFTGAHGGGLG